jgi:hypothetical protein
MEVNEVAAEECKAVLEHASLAGWAARMRTGRM